MTDKLDAILEAGIARGAAPGVSAIVVGRDGVRWQGAAGERVLGSGVKMTTDSVGAIYSMTKAITGAAAMQLVEQGRLDLDAPASDVLSSIDDNQVLDRFDVDGQPITRPPTTPVTLRHLLTHTSGFAYEVWNGDTARWYEVTGTPRMMSRQKAALAVPLMFDPGTRWEYGIGIDLAGLMVEEVTGITLGQYFAEHLTGPLGMNNTAFTPSPSMLERACGVHRRERDGSLAPLEPSPPENRPEEPQFEPGGGGLHGTMGDYGRFLRMILNDGELDGVRVLAPETVQMMAENHIGDLRVRELKSQAPPVSNDAEFFPGQPKSWGLTFQINEAPAFTGRPAGTLMWAGLANCFFWIDRQNGVAGAYLSQILPFADQASLDLFYEIETAVYAAL